MIFQQQTFAETVVKIMLIFKDKIKYTFTVPLRICYMKQFINMTPRHYFVNLQRVVKAPCLFKQT